MLQCSVNHRVPELPSGPPAALLVEAADETPEHPVINGAHITSHSADAEAEL
jgi:hypothetical protein